MCNSWPGKIILVLDNLSVQAEATVRHYAQHCWHYAAGGQLDGRSKKPTLPKCSIDAGLSFVLEAKHFTDTHPLNLPVASQLKCLITQLSQQFKSRLHEIAPSCASLLAHYVRAERPLLMCLG